MANVSESLHAESGGAGHGDAHPQFFAHQFDTPAQQFSAARRRRGEDQAHARIWNSSSNVQIAMRPLAHVVPAALAQILRAQPLSDGKVDFAWRTVVGPALARVTHVKLDGRVLLVDTAGALWSREIMRQSPVILKRLQAFLGQHTVDAIEVRRA